MEANAEVVNFPARIIKVESFTRYGSQSSTQLAGVFGLFGYLANQASLRSNWYTLSIADRGEVGVDSSDSFAIGQCVLLRVKKSNADNTTFAPDVAQIERYDGCQQ
jgi:hypothetical protein